MGFDINNLVVTALGHPFAPIGMGEHVRCSWRALRKAGLEARLFDIYKLCETEEHLTREFSPYLAKEFSDINIFHINGDEVEQALRHLSFERKKKGYNIVYPAWELENYPLEWAQQLDRFDEIWTPSDFIRQALVKVCKKPVINMSLACEIRLPYFLGRRYFGIPEDAYCFLFFYDLKSYATRKNPGAVIEAFAKTVKARPFSDACLVIKVNGSQENPDQLKELRQVVKQTGARSVIIDKVMSDLEIKNLVRACDCFLSLHRSEGFGRGMSESMALGKPVIGTGYSGNLEFMNDENSFLVPYKLIPLKKGDYPFWEGQVWAEPEIERASEFMLGLLDDPDLGYQIGKKGQRWVRQNLSYRAIGLRYAKRIREILAK